MVERVRGRGAKGLQPAITLFACASFAALAGVALALSGIVGGDRGQLANPGAIEAGSFVDSRIEYPQLLQQLSAPPGRLVVDSEGILWFPLYENGFQDAILYRYDPRTGSVSSIDLPDASGSQLFSGLELLPNGDVAVSYNNLVSIVGAKDKSVAVIELPPKPDAAAQQTLDEGHWITDTTVGSDGRLYIGRMNSASITVVDPGTGGISEMRVPPSFGPVERLESGPDGVYISNRFGAVDVERQVGRLTYGGDFVSIAASATELVAAPDGNIVAVSQEKSLLTLSAGGASPSTAFTAASSYLSGFEDAVMIDAKGSAWLSGRGTGVIAKVTSAGVDVFQLGSYVVPFRCPPSMEIQPADLCNRGIESMPTRVFDIAESPDGSIYFTDATALSIGVIKAGQ